VTSEGVCFRISATILACLL